MTVFNQNPREPTVKATDNGCVVKTLHACRKIRLAVVGPSVRSKRLRPEIDQLCFFDKITSELEIETKRSTEYGPNIEMMLKKWIEGTLGESLGDDFYAALKSGVKLCQYVSVFIPTFVNCDTSTFPIRKRL